MTPEELHNIFRTEEEFWWYQGMRAITRALLEPLPVRQAKRWLEAGCGTGYNALDFERHFGARISGVDLAPLGIRYCRQRRFDRSAVASVMELPFPDDCFDVVTSIDVLPVLPEGGDVRAFREFLRVLRPGGWLFVRAAAFRALRSRHSQYVAEGHRYRARELLGKLSALDCRIVRWTYANSFLSPVALFKFRIWENLRREPPHSGVEKIPPAWLNRTLLGALRLEAQFLRWGFRFLFGQSLIVVAQKNTASVK